MPGTELGPLLSADLHALRKALVDEVILLETWARADGGWSTNLVDRMRKRADELRRVLIGLSTAARPLG